MLVVIEISETETGFSASAPDLPALDIAASTRDQALAKAHLAVEVLLGAHLAEHGEFPAIRHLTELRRTAELKTAALYEVYVEDHQLAAMAKHQARA